MIVKYAAYALYNLLVLAFDLLWLLYMNTYWNELFIPKRLSLGYGMEMLYRFFVANIESGLIVFLVYLLNKKFAAYFLKERGENLPVWSAVGSIGLVLIFTAIAFYTIYRQGR